MKNRRGSPEKAAPFCKQVGQRGKKRRQEVTVFVISQSDDAASKREIYIITY